MKKKIISLTLIAVSLVLGACLTGKISQINAYAAEKTEIVELTAKSTVVDDIYNGCEKVLPSTDVTLYQPLCSSDYCKRAVSATGKTEAQRGSVTNPDAFFSVDQCKSVNFTCADGIIVNDHNNNQGDLFLNEVTYTSNYYVEAVKVYLTGVVVKDENGKNIKYPIAEDNQGYYVGIAWNRVGQENISDEEGVKLAKKYYTGIRKLSDDYFKPNFHQLEDGECEWTGINLPDDVVYATGVTLVDITDQVHDILETEGLSQNGYSKYTYQGAHNGGFDLESVYGFTKESLRDIIK